MTLEQNIELMAQYLRKYAPKYNILVYSPIIAQAILESGKFKSELAVNANNVLGLKFKKGRCPSALPTPYYKVGSEQNADSTYTSSAMQWFQFKDLEQCVIGYLDFINISRYSNLKGVTDPRTYLERIKADGYATSLKYVDNVCAVIQNYNLTKYDPINQALRGENKMKYKIAVGAGHGSQTAGKRTPDGYKEHEINVDVADFLEDELLRCGFEVVKIAWDDADATDDPDVPLSTRQAQVKSAKCDASVSCHANAHGNGKVYTTGQGVETLIHNNPAYVGDSRALAEKVQSYLIKGTKQKNRGVKTQSLAMCNCAKMGTKASILVEIGFMTNEYESALMKTQAFCKECAQEIAQGICEYFGVDYVKSNSNNNITSTTSSVEKEKTKVTYITHRIENNKWGNEIVGYNNENSMGYSGSFGKSIDKVAIKLSEGTITYCAHRLNGSWGKDITGYSTADTNKYAGSTNKPIDAVTMKADGINGTLKYRVHRKTDNKWGNWIVGFSKTNTNMYAGSFGKPIDAIQIGIE